MPLCTRTPVLLGKDAISLVVHMLFFLFRQWRFRPRPLHTLPRGSKAIAAANTVSAHVGPAPGVSASDSQSQSKELEVSKHSGGLSGTTLNDDEDVLVKELRHARCANFVPCSSKIVRADVEIISWRASPP